MSWDLKGTYLESCNCDTVCPCTTSGLTAPADHERCQVTLAFHIDEGQVNGAAIGDRGVVLFVDAPQVMSDGGWQVALYVDERAEDAQAEALVGIFAGQHGGPMAALAPLIGEVLGIHRAPVQFVDEGRTHSVSVGDTIDIAVEDQVAPQYGDDGPVMTLNGLFHPANTSVTVARSTRATGTDVHGRTWDFGGLNGHSAPFTWSA